MVLIPDAIGALRERSAEAADWFERNLPPDLPALSFGADEVEIVPKTSK